MDRSNSKTIQTCSAVFLHYADIYFLKIASYIVQHYYVLFSFFTWKWIFWNSASCKTSLEFIPCLSRQGLKMCLVPCASRRTRHAAFIKAVSSSLQRCSCSEAAGARYSNVPLGLCWGFNCLLTAVSQHGSGWKKPISCSQLRWTSVCSCVASMFFSVFGVWCVAEQQAQKKKGGVQK